MHVNQKLSVLFYLKRKNGPTDGKIPVYVRITIDGLKDEISLSCKVAAVNWDSDLKQVRPGEPKWKAINKKIAQMRTDIERCFDVMQSKNGLVTPSMIKEAYMSPLSGQQLQNEKLENLQFSEALDLLISRFLTYCDKVKKAHADGRTPGPHKLRLLNLEKEDLGEEIESLAKKANAIFDRKDHQKTFLLIVNDYLLNFLQLAFTGHRSPNTLEKWIGRKRRYMDFLRYRYKVEDMPLAKIEYSFIEEVFRYLLVQHQVIENTAMKYAQCVKEMMDRAVARGWVPANVFVIFKCKYADPDHDWLTMQEFETIRDFQFSKEKLNVIRDIFIFTSFTGLAYQEVRTLAPSDIITGMDGKRWISKNRQKTDGDETLPLLPLPLQILEKYKNYPVCIRRGRLLPVPSNEEYNRCLKEIGQETGITIILKTHKSRYFFANEVAYNNGVPLKTVSKMLGHKSVKTTEIYVRANRKNISESMAMVEDKLFTIDGKLRGPKVSGRQGEDLRDYGKEQFSEYSGGKVILMQKN
jgi:integrase